MTALHIVESVEFMGEIHAYADRWPMGTADDLDTLAASIAANGQRFPIVLDPEGRLIDGRNRLAACTLAGVAPTFVVDPTLTDEDAIGAYIWDVNGERRDMSKGQKAMLAALRPGTQSLLSKETGVSDAFVAKARVVIQWCAEEVIANVCGGLLALNDAYEQAQQIKATEQADEIARKKSAAEAKAKADEAARRLVDLRQARPDLAALVDAGQLPLADALTVRDRDLAAQRKAEADRRTWIKKLADSVYTAVDGAESAAHPNNIADTLAGLAEFPHPIPNRFSVARIRSAAAHLSQIADQMEATQ
jgi:hypothetical protein